MLPALLHGLLTNLLNSGSFVELATVESRNKLMVEKLDHVLVVGWEGFFNLMVATVRLNQAAPGQ